MDKTLFFRIFSYDKRKNKKRNISFCCNRCTCNRYTLWYILCFAEFYKYQYSIYDRIFPKFYFQLLYVGAFHFPQENVSQERSWFFRSPSLQLSSSGYITKHIPLYRCTKGNCSISGICNINTGKLYSRTFRFQSQVMRVKKFRTYCSLILLKIKKNQLKI